MSSVDYEHIAAAYAAGRTIHPGVFAALQQAIAVGGPEPRVLEVGSGTGNYIGALQAATGCRAWGVEPAPAMLAVAASRWPSVTFLPGAGAALPLSEAAFDFVFTVDVIHHIEDGAAYFRAARRVLVPGGRTCTVTDSVQIIAARCPLTVYWPETVAVELRRYPPLAQLWQWMAGAGLRDDGEAVVEFDYLLDNSDAYRERAYSSLRLIDDAAFARGLVRLEADLTRGPVQCTSRYVMLWGQAAV